MTLSSKSLNSSQPINIQLSQSANNQDLSFINYDIKQQHPVLLKSDKAVQRSSMNLTLIPNSALNHIEVNQQNTVLTVVDIKHNQVVHNNIENNSFVSNSNVHISPVLQVKDFVLEHLMS